jgi:cytochrome c
VTENDCERTAQKDCDRTLLIGGRAGDEVDPTRRRDRRHWPNGDTLMKKLIAAAVLIATSTGAGLAQDVEKGANVFKQCQVCHSIGPGAKNKIGPELNGLDGRTAGVVPNFNYSDANKNSGVVWNEANFKEYAKYPRAFVPGTKMIFPGLKDQQQVNDLWAYVKQFDASGNIKK